MKTTTELTDYYESIEINFATGQTDVALSSLGTTFLSRFAPGNVVERWPSRLVLRTNQTISIKLNANTNDAITIASTDSPFTLEGVRFSEIYLTNASGSIAALKFIVGDTQY